MLMLAGSFLCGWCASASVHTDDSSLERGIEKESDIEAPEIVGIRPHLHKIQELHKVDVALIPLSQTAVKNAASRPEAKC